MEQLMQHRRHFKQTSPLGQRLTEEAQRLRNEARRLPQGIEREQIIRRARQAETGAVIDKWLSFRALQPPR